MRGFLVGLQRGFSYLWLTLGMTIMALLLMVLLTIPPRVVLLSVYGDEPAKETSLVVWACFAITCGAVYYVLRLGDRWAAQPGLELFGYLVRGAAIFTLCLASFMFLAGAFAEAGFAVFTAGADLLRLTMLAIDNLLKVLLFDVLEVFEVNLSEMQPQNWVARLYIVVARILFSLLIVKTLVEAISLSRFSKDLAVAPTRGAKLLLYGSFFVSVITLLAGSALYVAFADLL